MKYLSINLLALSLLLIIGCGQEEDAYDRIDTDDDNTVNRQEYLENWYGAGYFNLWDRNDDGQISEAEWESGLKANYEDYAYTSGEFEEWNLNGDNFITKEELANGLFSIYDTDGDGEIERAEFEKFSSAD